MTDQAPTRKDQVKRRDSGCIPSGAPQQKRPMSAIIPTIMGDQQGPGIPRSGSATSGPQASKQHKLKQRFTVIRKLGKGTYGKVQLAVNKETGQEVAIKTIKKTKIENEQDLERVRREIQIMSSIEHPHIIHIYEVFENKDKIVLIMQYAPGGELYEYVSESKMLDEHEARRLFRQIATAIYYCHQNKICHRDLKLENILLDEKNNAKLADFGLSNVFDKSRQLKTFCGSPLYASPEIVQGSPYEGPEVDCWSLGVLLYTLVYGAMPFDGSNFKRLVKQISEASYYEPKQRSQASHLIGRLLCADPLKRASIKDICLDPWVNGYQPGSASPLASPAAGLRVSPTNNGQSTHHPPLLKVAQDMANLTPVRLDILLALMPGASVAQQTVHTAADFSPEQEKIVLDQATNVTRQQSAIEGLDIDQRNPIMDHFGSELMEVDDNRSTSPVASYVVRDIEPRESAQNPPEMVIDSEVSADKPDELSAVGEGDKDSANVGETEENIETNSTKDEPSKRDEPASEEIPQPEVKTQDDEQIQVASVPDEPCPLNQTDESNHQVSNEPSPTMPSKSAEQVDAGSLNAEAAKEQEPIRSDNEPSGSLDATIESKLGTSPAEDSKTEGTNDAQLEEVSETKPKRIKKRIVVVKKKKKVAKKDDKEQLEATEASEVSETTKPAGADRTDPKAVGSGPRKVRIPETFQADSSPVSEQPSSPRTVATRRQSALIADVSQKLLQQQQQNATGQPTSSAIEQDQHQLASVRVSSTKSEFERRASLAAALMTPPASASPKGSDRSLAASPGQQQAQQQVGSEDPINAAAEPVVFGGEILESVPTRREQIPLIDSTTVAAELVIKLEPSQVQQLRVVASPAEPLTPTNTNEVSNLCGHEEVPEKCADRLSVDVQANRDGSRSDSVETIKAEWQEIPTATKATESLSGKMESSPSRPNVRSSLQLNLQSVCGSSSSSSTPSRVSTGGSMGPAPITRSYKKVTFTKDGTCVTETGRIYSTQSGDGTVRHVERKSKVTHYPSDTGAACGSAGVRAAEATTHEEIVYESTHGGDPFQTHPFLANRAILPQSHQLSRLVMPTDSFFDESTTREQQAQELQEPSAANRAPSSMASEQIYQKARADSGSSCSSGSTDVFDDIFDNWTGAISMFNQGRHLDELRGSLMNRTFVTGSPLPFGRLTKPRSRRNSGSVRESQHRPQSSGASIFPEVAHQRCESATTAGRSVFGPESHPRRHRHRHSSSRGPSSTGRSSADPSGYESDVPFERPASATLGSARGRFGSSNLFPRAEVPVAEFGIDTDSFFGNDWREESLLERMELEHEMLRRKFAQQRKQLWKSSTPSLCQPSGSGMGGFSRGLSAQPPSLSDHGQTVAPQGQQVRSFVCHTNSGASLRQSTPLSSSPVRRNTANLADHLPPRQAHTNRSSSKTSMITSQLANIQLSRPDERPSLPVPSQQQFKSASFIELKRNSSASSSKQQPASVQSPHQTAASLTFPAQLTPTTYSSATGEPTISDGNLTEKIDTEALGESQRGAETNSRIQNWLLQSAGNLSISSGSKSSTSDATLPSSSGRSDITAGTYLASSAGQMLRHDDLLAASSSNQSLSHGQPVRLHQQRQHSSRTIIGHQLPPMAGRSPSDSLDIRQGARSPRPAQPISLIVRSSSRQSISELNEPGHVERHKVYEAVETFVSGDGSQTGQSITRAHQTATHSTSAQVSNRKVFAFPDEAVAQRQHQQQSSQIIKTQLVTTSSCEKVFPKQSMSAQLAETQHQTSEMFASNAQPMSISTRPLDDFSDFDSLLGSGVELESHSSSSLLDQLRSRGYRSIMNQRMVGPSAQYQQQPPTQTTTTSVEPDVVTSSSNSMMTMSSSGVGCGFTGSIEEPPAQLRRPTQPRQQQHHQQQQQQQQQPNQRDCFLPIDTQNRELECASQHQPADRMNACTQHNSVCQDGQLPVSTKNAMDASNQGDNIRGDEVDSWNPDRVLASSTVERHTETIADQEAMTSATELEDEDVREAKSNIKEYLDRIKETEKFIKSIHEEEEKSQRHRQESFLFNNLILSTKLNGFKTNGQLESSLDMPAMDMCFNAPCGPYSAPVTMMARSSYNVDHDPASDLKLKSSSGMRDFGNNHLDTSLSCFSSDLFKPISCSPNSASNSSLINSASVGSYRDPLEPIQPISMHAYAPPARWQRSRSQLGNDYDYHGRIESPLVGTGRRPLSASIDSNPSSNPYFPTRHRRSTSQVRYPPAVNPLMSTMIAPCSDDSSSMVSEYRSSFGPNLGQPNRHQRHQSLAPRSPCRSSQIPRATSPSFSKTLTDDNVHDQDADDDDDLGMSAYRPSSYVPKVVPEGTHTSRHRDRIASRLSNSTNVGLRARSISRDLEKGERSPLIQSSVAGRRSSVQTMNGSAASNDEKETNRDSDTDSATRRRSWTTNDSSVSSACGSRLSELEQRIQANKRRREELLQGINSQSTDKLAASTNEQQPTSRLGRGPNNDDAADDSDQSCGFERPSRPINRTAYQHETCPAPTEFPSDPQDSKKPTSSINKFRASRLESMEARIRRKSYCVKVRSPERTARK